LAQPVDVDLHEVCFRIEVRVPDVLDDFAAGNDIGRAAQKKFQQVEFFRCQRDSAAPKRHSPTVAVEFQVGMPEHASGAGAAANERANAGEQFGYGKRFRQIVVRSGVQPLDSLLDQTARGEHQDWGIDSGVSQFTANMETAQTGQTNVEQNTVVSN